MNSIIHYFKRNQWQLLLIFLLGHILVSSLYIKKQDLTFDEKPYYNYAVRWIYGNVERRENIDDSKTPAVFPAIIPRALTQLFFKNYSANDNGVADMLQGRFVMCIYTLLIAIILFYWMRDLTGNDNLFWCFPLLLFLFDPLILAYSMIILSDMASGAAMISTLFFLWRFYKFKSEKYFYLFSFSFAFSLIVKPSFVFLLPCLLIMLLLKKKWYSEEKFIFFNTKRIFILIVSTLLVINIFYQFKETFKPLTNYKFQSKLFQKTQNRLINIGGLPIPFPSSYIYSLDLVQRNKEVGGGVEGSSYRGVFLNGNTKLKGGFWNYYLVVGFIKMPVITILFFIVSLLYGIYFFKRKSFWVFHCWFVIPILFFGFVLSFLNPFQIGIRHLLIVYPLFFIPIAVLLFHFKIGMKKIQYIFAMLFLIFIIDIAYYFPNYISYTNWFAIDKKNVYQRTNDSNIDYGQSLSKIDEFIKLHPDYKIPSTKPVVGKCIASVEQIQKFGYLYPNSYNWLLKYKPTNHYNYSLLLFDIKESDLKQ